MHATISCSYVILLTSLNSYSPQLTHLLNRIKFLRLQAKNFASLREFIYICSSKIKCKLTKT